MALLRTCSTDRKHQRVIFNKDDDDQVKYPPVSLQFYTLASESVKISDLVLDLGFGPGIGLGSRLELGLEWYLELGCGSINKAVDNRRK